MITRATGSLVRIGVIGAGQLARMMISPAVELGIELRVFGEREGESADLAVTQRGSFTDAADVLRFAETVDVVTFDHEHVPQDVLAALSAAGVPMHPSPAALVFAQDKIAMRERLSALGLPVPDWKAVESAAQLDAFIAEHGGRCVVKTPRGGYDGKGVRLVTAAHEVADWFDNGPLLAEELIEFRRELSQLLARRPSGEVATWPVVESVQRDGVCAEVIAPAPNSRGKIAEVAVEIATSIAENLDVTGVLAVELFETTDDRLVINELAMRPHNSGHFSIDGSRTSQFEQHLRAVLDLPLGATDAREPWTVMVNVLGGVPDLAGRYAAALADQPGVKLHFYGKESRPGRKVGHVTATGKDLDEVVYRARAATAFFEV
jgi:5-(carboxyamino)imidazole ribonucleotide synthase